MILKKILKRPSTENKVKYEDAVRIIKAIENKQSALYLSGISDQA